MLLEAGNVTPPTISQMLPGILIGFAVLFLGFFVVVIYFFRLLRRMNKKNDA